MGVSEMFRSRRCERCFGQMVVMGGCDPDMVIEYDDAEEFLACFDCGLSISLGIPGRPRALVAQATCK